MVDSELREGTDLGPSRGRHLVGQAEAPTVVLVLRDYYHYVDVRRALETSYRVRLVSVRWTFPPKQSRLMMIAGQVLRELAATPRILRAGRQCGSQPVLAAGASGYATLLAARILTMLGARPRTFLFNFYIHQMGQRAWVKHLLRWLLRGRVGIALQASTDVAYFRELAPHIFAARVVVGIDPDYVGTPEIELGDYVFSGGYTNRDYTTLLDVARGVPDVPFLVACWRANSLPDDLPANVQVLFDCSSTDFHSLMARSRLVVVPLKDDVGASGQMVALAAMLLGKTTVYTEYSALSQLFDDGVTGFSIPPGDVTALAECIRLLYPAQKRLSDVGAAARSKCERCFLQRHHEESIVGSFAAFMRDA